MSTRSSASNESTSSSTRHPLLCSHGERPVLRVSFTKENPGRKFWGCIFYDVLEDCSFFRWADMMKVPAVYEEMVMSGCTPDRKARAMLRSTLRYMKKQRLKS